MDAFGPNGADGTFSGGLQSAMTTLRDNRDVLLSVLEPFIRDPVIEWKRQRTQQKAGKKDKPTSNCSHFDFKFQFQLCCTRFESFQMQQRVLVGDE